MKHFDNFYFSIDPRSAFIGHYNDEGRNTKRQLINVTIAIVFLDIGKNLKNILNIVPDVQALYITKTILNTRKIFLSRSLEILKLRPVITRRLREGQCLPLHTA